MISLDMARRLKAAGLAWEPAAGDRFIVPDRGMDEQVFTVNDMAVIPEILKGTPAVTFHGTPEWALDYVYVGDTLWLPSEGQLRGRLQEALGRDGTMVFDLLFLDGAYTCRFEWRGEQLAFRSTDAADAYAQALEYALARQKA